MNALSILDKPWLRTILSALGSFAIPLLLILSMLGPDDFYTRLVDADAETKLFIAVGAFTYIVTSYLSILPYFSDSPWSHHIGLANKRFSELVFYASHFEEYPGLRYGINANVYWPRLFLVLPVATKETLVQVRSSYITAGILGSSCLWWFRFLCPLLSGALLYLAICERNERPLYLLGFLLMLVLYAYNEHMNVAVSFAFKRYKIIAGLTLMLIDRTSTLRFILLSLVGLLLCQAISASHLHLSWHGYLTCWEPLQLGWLKILTFGVEIVLLFLLVQTLGRWFISAGIAYGELTCAVFDLHRTDLARHLGIELSSNIIQEQKEWKSHENFLHEGSVLRAGASPEQIAPCTLTLFQEIKKLVVEDWKSFQELVAKSSIESQTSRLRKVLDETLAAFTLIPLVALAQTVACTFVIFHIFPEFNLSVANNALDIEVDFALFLLSVPIITTAAAFLTLASTLAFYIFKRRSPPRWVQACVDNPHEPKSTITALAVVLFSIRDFFKCCVLTLLGGLFLFDTIDKFDSLNQLSKPFWSIQTAPTFLRRHR
ncbi:hypothetical protein KF913_19445 [Candidatus Obscuribacterales bacterium]|nr:hypothetical protein [Candidatus Obscuribacterales bacterium]